MTTHKAMVTDEALFNALADAYENGARWRDRYGDLEFLGKAAYDYADKNCPPALAQAETQPVAWMKRVEDVDIEGEKFVGHEVSYLGADGAFPVFASPVPAKREAGVDIADAVIAFFVKHGMLDQRDEYDVSDVVASLSDNYEPSLSTSSTPADGEDTTPTVTHLEGLTTFAKAMIQVAFKGGDISGADIQELGVQHGLLSCVPFDPEKHKDPEGYAEEGDYWYVYAGPLATTEGQP